MTKNKLHPGVKWSWRVERYFFRSFLFLPFLVFFIAMNILTFESNSLIFFGLIFFLIAWIIFSEIMINMSYNRWFYEFTDKEIKIEYGIIWKTYKSIPYERIQNLDIRRGIFARIFGFSAIDIQTAGYSGGYSRRSMSGSEGHLPAVNIKKAEDIREFVIKKISGKKTNSGGL